MNIKNSVRPGNISVRTLRMIYIFRTCLIGQDLKKGKVFVDLLTFFILSVVKVYDLLSCPDIEFIFLLFNPLWSLTGPRNGPLWKI